MYFSVAVKERVSQICLLLFAIVAQSAINNLSERISRVCLGRASLARASTLVTDANDAGVVGRRAIGSDTNYTMQLVQAPSLSSLLALSSSHLQRQSRSQLPDATDSYELV